MDKIRIIEEERNNEYNQLMELPSVYIDAWIFVNTFILESMNLNLFHYELVEIAYKFDIGVRYTRLYNNNDPVIEEEKQELYNLVEYLKEYLKQECRYEDLEYIEELENNEELFM